MTTKIADVIVPEVFNPYTIQRSMELNAFYASGVVQNTTEFNRLANSGGTLLNMPYWEDLTGDSEVLSDNGALTPGKITTGQDRARLQARGRAWGANDLAYLLAGDDPMRAIGDLVAGYWNREMQKILLATLAGVFASPSMAPLVHDISAETGDAALISGSTFVDAAQKLGDAKGQLTAVAMHSAVEAYLAKQQLIEYVQEANQSDRVPTYMGKRVIVDDSLSFDTGTKVATTYLFGSGAFALGNGDGLGAVPLTETDRDTLAGEDYLITRRVFILHPRGVRWIEASVSSAFPTNTELADGANWERVYEPKAIRIVQFKHKIA